MLACVKEVEREERSLAGNIDADVYWEFKVAATNKKLQIKDAVELAAKLFLNEYYAERGEEFRYDVSAEFSNKSNET